MTITSRRPMSALREVQGSPIVAQVVPCTVTTRKTKGEAFNHIGLDAQRFNKMKHIGLAITISQGIGFK